jgi:hypothetical protein
MVVAAMEVIKTATPLPRMAVPFDINPGKVFKHQMSDPDRIRIKHTVPSLFQTSPSERQIEVHKLYENRGYFITAIYNDNTPEEWRALIDMTNEKGYTPALVNIGRGNQQYLPDVRDHARCIIDDDHMTDFFFKLLAPYIPPEKASRKLHNLNERLRFLCYFNPGQRFEVHYDGNFTKIEGPRKGDTSFVTIQIYLNSDSIGGETLFHLKPEVRFQPREGAVVIFSQDLPHEGCELKGGIKYTVRTEAMYAPCEPICRPKKLEDPVEGSPHPTSGGIGQCM